MSSPIETGRTAGEGPVLFVEEQRFDHVGAFSYSPQPGTPAAGLPDPVPHELATERYGRLMELAQGISLERNRELVGRELDVLVESAAPAESAEGAPEQVGRQDTTVAREVATGP